MCRRCGEEKPLTTEYFSWYNKEKGTLQTMCKECFKKYMHERLIKIHEENGERLEKIKEHEKRYRENHLEEERERCRVKALRQYYENREKMLAKNKEYKKSHREELAQKKREYCKEHYHNDPVYKFTVRMRNMINASFARYETYKPKKNIDIVGIPSPKLRDYLLGTFRDIYGYDWDFVEPTEIDHIVPLASAKTKEDIAKLCHYTNLRLIKAADNRYKGAKMDYQIGDLPT